MAAGEDTVSLWHTVRVTEPGLQAPRCKLGIGMETIVQDPVLIEDRGGGTMRLLTLNMPE